MEPVLRALHVPDGTVVLGVLIDPVEPCLMPDYSGQRAYRACDIGRVCGCQGEPVVAWICDQDIIGECVDCLRISVEHVVDDQEVTLT